MILAKYSVMNLNHVDLINFSFSRIIPIKTVKPSIASIAYIEKFIIDVTISQFIDKLSFEKTKEKVVRKIGMRVITARIKKETKYFGTKRIDVKKSRKSPFPLLKTSRPILINPRCSVLVHKNDRMCPIIFIVIELFEWIIMPLKKPTRNDIAT